CQQHDDSPRTC
nr:immunoglobulin light chain junction region [Macaca mulatta]